MTKEQFIMELEQCLQGEVSAYELSDSLTYYLFVYTAGLFLLSILTLIFVILKYYILRCV